MHLNTDCIYLCVDVTNASIHVLTPTTNLEVFELRIDNPDPASTDAAEYKLLREVMQEHDFDLP